MGNHLKLLMIISAASVLALIVGSAIQHAAMRGSKRSGRGGGASDDEPWWAQKTKKDADLGQSIRKVASDIRAVHDRINKLGKKLPTLPPGQKPADLVKNKKKKESSTAAPGEISTTTKAPLQTIPVGEKAKAITSPPHEVVNYDDSIFVSIASYRDEQCAPTVRDIYDKAQNPKAIFLGIVEQHDDGDPTCMPREFQDCQLSAFCPSDQIQTRRILPKDAKGPTYGRYIGMLMYRNEKYFLLIDSHNRFVTHWDNIVVNMYKSLPTKKGVLSHYPEAWHNPDDKGQTNPPLDGRQTTTYLCTAKFVEQGYPRLDGFIVHKGKAPREQPWAAAGFLFADSSVIKEVPFDPYLDYVFDGEEILYSIRMWTHGWDIFSPSENILYHYYYRTKAKKFWSLLPPDWTQRREKAHRRIQWYLGTLKKGTDERMVALDSKEDHIWLENEKYGLGKERTMAQWTAYAGVDMKNRKIENKFCPKA